MSSSVLWVTAHDSWDEGTLAAAFGTAWLQRLGVSAALQPIRRGLEPAMVWPSGVAVAESLVTERRRAFRRPQLIVPESSGLSQVVIDQSVFELWGSDLVLPSRMRAVLLMRSVPETGFEFASLHAYDAVWAANRSVWDVVRSWKVVPESRLWLVPPPPLGVLPGDHGVRSGTLVTAGVLDAVKGLDMVFNALTVLRDRGHTWPLVVLGDGPERERWAIYAKALGLDVRFESDMLDWDAAIGQADVLIAPQFRDGLGWDVAAAVRAGTRIVMADLPALREHIRHTSAAILAETRAADLVEALEGLVGTSSPGPEPVPDDGAAAVWQEMLG